MRQNAGIVLALALSAAAAGHEARADFFHYDDILIGDRAMGVGGAFTAVADDASALYYNPAGLARLPANEVSGSVTAIYGSRTKVRGLFDADYRQRSASVVPAMLGAAYRLDWPGPEWVGAAGVFVPDQSSAERDEVIRDDARNQIVRWHHVLKVEGESTLFAAGLARPIGAASAFGFGLGVVRTTQLIQQAINARFGPVAQDDQGRALYYNMQTDRRQEMTATAIEPSVGIVHTFQGGTSMGLSFKRALIVQQHVRLTADRYGLLTRDDDSIFTEGDAGTMDRAEEDETGEKPLQEWPSLTRLGFAWPVARGVRVMLDVSHHGSDGGADPSFRRRAVTNLATGCEVRHSREWAQSFGAFTNADARPDVERGSSSGAEQVHFLGLTYAAAYTRDKARYTLGALVQLGRGKGQYAESTREPQEILTQAFGLSGSIAHTD